ncbi:MAG: Holliday junction branch migration protein RuvA [Proteobacteria bacterium]|nr:Holliday junction branch migration protein RuvA [Pseudomonadota bacterium]MBU1060295.1 Holliday junction branch migration protein RuvA [Pseudomonadota bacterium]
MIASLTGTVQFIGSDRVVVEVGGVGYEVFLSRDGVSRLPEKGEDLFLYIHTNVREDAIVLFGFQEQSEKEMFLTLKAVSGIGPKLSLAILSGMQLDALCQAIFTEDINGLTSIQGVGKKTAERICVELKDKVGGFQAVDSLPASIPEKLMSGGTLVGDALSALVNLGYPEQMVRQALSRVKKQVGGDFFKEMALEELIKEGLRALT